MLGFAAVGKEVDLVVLGEEQAIGGDDARAIAGFTVRTNNSAMAVDGASRAAGEIGQVGKSCAGVGRP